MKKQTMTILGIALLLCVLVFGGLFLGLGRRVFFERKAVFACHTKKLVVLIKSWVTEGFSRKPEGRAIARIEPSQKYSDISVVSGTGNRFRKD